MAVICGFDEGDALVDRQSLSEICSSLVSRRVQDGVQGYPVVPPSAADDDSIKNNAARRPQLWTCRIVSACPRLSRGVLLSCALPCIRRVPGNVMRQPGQADGGTRAPRPRRAVELDFLYRFVVGWCRGCDRVALHMVPRA